MIDSCLPACRQAGDALPKSPMNMGFFSVAGKTILLLSFFLNQRTMYPAAEGFSPF
jgi:hypothetical protein